MATTTADPETDTEVPTSDDPNEPQDDPDEPKGSGVAREPNELNADTVAIPKSQGRVKWQVPVLKPEIELYRDLELEHILGKLKTHYGNLAPLRELEIRVYWKRNGRTKQGAPNLGGVMRPNPWYEVGSGTCHFMLWLACDHISDQGWTGYQLEAFLYRLLCSCRQDEEGAYTIAAPDFAGFLPEIEAYGVWHGPIRAAAEILRQPRLFEE